MRDILEELRAGEHLQSCRSERGSGCDCGYDVRQRAAEEIARLRHEMHRLGLSSIAYSSIPKPDLTDPRVILSLRECGIEMLTFTADSEGNATINGRRIRKKPFSKISVPIMPAVLAHQSGIHDLAMVEDESGVLWSPVLTSNGWRRQRAL